jgi:uncharacterized protein
MNDVRQEDGKKMKKLWIDLENSPHVPFFYPIIKEMELRGYSVVLTARDCYQVCGLLDLYGLSSHVIGRHHGKNKLFKIAGTVTRSTRLLRFAMEQKPDLALSHGSRSQLITASMLRIPAIWIADYEYSQKIPFVRPNQFIVPEVMDANRCWMHDTIVKSYPGIKEDVYVPFFKPDPAILKDLGLDSSRLLVTIRPPATEAHYHNPVSEELFCCAVNYLSDQPNLQMIILPRSEKEMNWIRNKWSDLCVSGKVIIPEGVVNGLNLIWHSDFVISGGGTMNREAAALGVPVYSIFRGSIGAVDRYLEKTGRLVLLETPDDVKRKVCVAKRQIGDGGISTNHAVLKTIVNEIVLAMDSRNDS